MSEQERLYYTDSYTTRFESHIVEQLRHKGQPVVVLDETHFYPTSGGQPADRGQISDIPVVDVSIREEDGAVLHWLESEVVSEKVTAEIDWPRRFDHMQHHTGQHILSQAFIRVIEAETVSFHLSSNTVTIDLDKEDLTPAQVEAAELLANRIVWQNRPVTIHRVTPEEAKNLPLRQIPPIENSKLRLIDIEDFDLTACGGTHVARTGEVGPIKIVKHQRRGRQLRLEFRCGQRALHDYQQKHTIVDDLVATLTTGRSEIVDAVKRLQEEVREAQRAVKKQQADLLHFEAVHLLAQGTHQGEITIISRVFTDYDLGRLRALGNQLTENEGVVALLGLAGTKAQLVFSRSADAPGKMNQLIQPALRVLGSAAGGGTETFAQGGGPAAAVEDVRRAIEQSEKLLRQQLTNRAE
jgi:alanyl-tRNA synthetase